MQIKKNKINKINIIIASLFAAFNIAYAEEQAQQNWQLSIGGGGETINGQPSSVGVDVDLSTGPFKSLPNLWFGVVQGAYWEPYFFGSTDLNSNWSFHVYKNLYLNTGWNVGALYSSEGIDTWRTGPQASFQLYIGDNSYMYTGVDYDLWLSNREAESGFRWSFGVGLTW